MKTAPNSSTWSKSVSGEYRKPVRVVAFNTAEGWARDVSEDIAWEVLKRIAAEGKTIPPTTRQFTEFHVGKTETLLAENAAM
jgi:hypothetical protein